MTIEIIKHATQTWPSGLTTHSDIVQREADDVGRQEVTIQGAIAAQCDVPIYAYLPEQSEFGLDPWRYIEGLDEYIDGSGFDIWFESGSCKKVTFDACNIRFSVDAGRV